MIKVTDTDPFSAANEINEIFPYAIAFTNITRWLTVHGRKVKVDKKLMRVTSLTSLRKVTIRILRAKHRTDTELNKYQQKLFPSEI